MLLRAKRRALARHSKEPAELVKAALTQQGNRDSGHETRHSSVLANPRDHRSSPSALAAEKAEISISAQTSYFSTYLHGQHVDPVGTLTSPRPGLRASASESLLHNRHCHSGSRRLTESQGY